MGVGRPAATAVFGAKNVFFLCVYLRACCWTKNKINKYILVAGRRRTHDDRAAVLSGNLYLFFFSHCIIVTN